MIKNIFKKNINLFAPFSNEYLFDYIYLLGYTDKDLKKSCGYDEIKAETLWILEKLLNLKIIYIYTWCNNSHLNGKVMSSKEILKQIDSLWFKGAEYPDFYEMVMFGTQEWYTDKLWKMGMNHTTNWETFVKNNIGDLEQWIEENRPKN